MKKLVFIVLSLMVSIQSYSQIIFGANNYTEYHIGTLPIIISVPHGGSLTPAEIPERTCNNAVTVTDKNTIELAKQIDSAFVQATGCHPYLILCNLHRSKLDCNRKIEDGACGNATAENAWREFHNFIVTAQSSAQNQFGGKAFYIDLHGHGNPIQRLELGYLLYDYELAYTDSVLNTNKYVGYSSIQNLVSTNANAYTHAQLLRGDFALGTLLGNAGFPSVPSKQIPFPQSADNYFSGGYNIANHTSYAQNNTVNGVQIECNYTHVRDNYTNRKLFADSIVSVLIQFLKIHQQLNLTNCTATGIPNTLKTDFIRISPNPATDVIQFTLTENMSDFEIEISNIWGQTILKARNQTILNVEQYPRGIYMVKITDKLGNMHVEKIVLQ